MTGSRILLCFLLVACRGTIGTPDGPGPLPTIPNPAVALTRCESPGASNTHPLRRLTAAQYRGQIQSVFGLDVSDLRLPEHAPGQYDNDATLAVPTPTMMPEYIAAAEIIAARSMTSREWLVCDPVDLTCVESTALSLAASLFRRELSAEDAAPIREFTAELGAELGGEGALGVVIEALLLSPDFLYMGEVGVDGDAPAGLRALSSEELANRLSLFLWNVPATPEFRQRVETTEYEVLLDEVLADSRTLTGFRHFLTRWLALSSGEGADHSLFPELSVDDTVRAGLLASALRTLEYAFWEAASTEELFTGNVFFVNDRLAPIFGVAPPGTDELVPMSFPPEERAGALTHPSILAVTSKRSRHSPTRRGTFIMRNILCRQVRPPPPDVNDELPDGDTDEALTTRDRLNIEHNRSPACSGCHVEIDGIGFAFENYDAVGRYRTHENGVAVDASGQINGDDYLGALGLGERLVHNDEVALCMSEHLFRYGMGRAATEVDECQLREMAVDLREQGGDLRGLVRGFLMTDAFTHMPLDETP